MAMYTLYYACFGLSPENEKFCVGALKELSHLLMLPPVERQINIQPLSPTELESVGEILSAPNRDIDEIFHTLDDHFPSRPMFIYCTPDMPLAATILANQDKYKHVKWGGASIGSGKAVTWLDGNSWLTNKHLIWHETLHVLGAYDCYDPSDRYGPLRCGRTNCLMQYEPSQETVGKWPFLCSFSAQCVAMNLPAELNPMP